MVRAVPTGVSRLKSYPTYTPSKPHRGLRASLPHTASVEKARPMAQALLLKERPLLTVPVPSVAVLIFALPLVPIHQLNRGRHDAHKARSLHRLEPLAAAAGHLPAAVELQPLAAARLHNE